jgi:hypothetical protein
VAGLTTFRVEAFDSQDLLSEVDGSPSQLEKIISSSLVFIERRIAGPPHQVLSPISEKFTV